jgi:hypothetical protein
MAVVVVLERFRRGSAQKFPRSADSFSTISARMFGGFCLEKGKSSVGGGKSERKQ